MNLPPFFGAWKNPPPDLGEAEAAEYCRVVADLNRMRTRRPPVIREQLIAHAIAFGQWLRGEVSFEDGHALLELIELYRMAAGPIVALPAPEPFKPTLAWDRDAAHNSASSGEKDEAQGQ